MRGADQVHAVDGRPVLREHDDGQRQLRHLRQPVRRRPGLQQRRLHVDLRGAHQVHAVDGRPLLREHDDGQRQLRHLRQRVRRRAGLQRGRLRADLRRAHEVHAVERAPPYCANTSTSSADCGTCGNACAAGQACVAGICRANCSTSQTVCGGMCTNTAVDPANCNTCGHVCSFANASAACLSAGCYLAACDVGFLNCNGSQADGCEVNKNTSAANCGACGRSCLLGESCNAGVCTANLRRG